MSDDRLRPYRFHGVEFGKYRDNAKDAEGECPYCHNIVDGEQKRPKFSVNLSTGQYQCWHCKARGNLQKFLEHIHQSALEKTTTNDYKTLAEFRLGIPWTMFRDHKWALCNRMGSPRWLIPVYSARDTLVTLRVYQVGKPVMQTSGFPLAIYRLNHLAGRGPVYVCEGESSPLALERLRKAAKVKASVLGIPGAAVFKEEWLPLFKGRDVVWCYDNDSGGQDGTEHVAKLFEKTKTPRSFRTLHWPSDTLDGYDPRDLVYDELDKRKSDPVKVWASFEKMLIAPSKVLTYEHDGKRDTALEIKTAEGTKLIELPKRTSFASVIKDFKSRFFLDENKQDGLAVMLATVLSIQLPGDPIWMFTVGPPGSGKTLFLETLGASPWCMFRSSLTPASLISGYIADEDPSLIPQLQGKVLILKDYTEILSMPRDRQEEIYGILRGAYDGHATKTFGNGAFRDYPDCHFAMLAGVTDAIHGNNQASLGERFLKFQLVEGRDYDPTAHIRAAISGMAKQVENEEFLKGVVASYTNWWVENLKLPKSDKWVETRLIALAQIVSHLRASVTRSFRDEIAYRPTPEIGTRPAKQLKKLAECLAIVLNRPKIDRRCWSIVEKIAMDSSHGWGLDIVRVLASTNGKLVTKSQIEDAAVIPSTTCQRKLESMLAVGAVMQKKIPSAGVGHPAWGWTLSPTMQQLWKEARIGE